MKWIYTNSTQSFQVQCVCCCYLNLSNSPLNKRDVSKLLLSSVHCKEDLEIRLFIWLVMYLIWYVHLRSAGCTWTLNFYLDFCVSNTQFYDLLCGRKVAFLKDIG